MQLEGWQSILVRTSKCINKQMSSNGHTNIAHPDEADRLPEAVPGAFVLGGDYQGLGIVRSLGRRGVPVCVVDDERSISRFSRYATVGVRVSDLRNADTVVQTLLQLGNRLNLKDMFSFLPAMSLYAQSPAIDALSRNSFVFRRRAGTPFSGHGISAILTG